jgi:preprotein translocase subunit SecG
MVLISILIVFFIIVAAAMILIILVQRPQGGGLSGAFGGAGGGSDTVFGGRTGDALTLATVVCFVLFLGLSIGLNVIEVNPTPTTTDQTPAAEMPLDGMTLPLDQTQPGAGLPPGTSPGAPTPDFAPLQLDDIRTFPQAPSGDNGAQVPASGAGVDQPE